MRQAVGAEKVLSAPRVWGDSGAEYGRTNTWMEASAKITLTPGDGVLSASFDSGQQWGLGIGLAPTGERLSDGSADVLGASSLEADLMITAGKKFQLFINESGVGDPGSTSFAGVGGADGEGWNSPTYVGTGQRQTVRFDLAQAELRGSWGDQHGNKTVDLQAIKSLDLAIAGNQGSGELKLYRVRFMP